jgi:hypothetical protein
MDDNQLNERVANMQYKTTSWLEYRRDHFEQYRELEDDLALLDSDEEDEMSAIVVEMNQIRVDVRRRFDALDQRGEEFRQYRDLANTLNVSCFFFRFYASFRRVLQSIIKPAIKNATKDRIRMSKKRKSG